MVNFLYFILVLICISFPVLAFAEGDAAITESVPETAPRPSFWKDKFRYSGELRQETAFRFVNEPNFSKIKQFAKIDLKFNFNDHYRLKLGGRAYYDAVYDLTEQYPPNVRTSMRDEIQLRDAYLDILYPKLNIRLGHQQIVWGEALGQFFADVVVPKDLREFLWQLLVINEDGVT